jgi:hypothetical protein
MGGKITRCVRYHSAIKMAQDFANKEVYNAKQVGGGQHNEREGADIARHRISNHMLIPPIQCLLGEGWPGCPPPVFIFEGGGGPSHQSYSILVKPPDIK